MVRKIKVVNVDMTIKSDPVVEIQNEAPKDVIQPEIIQPIEEAPIIEEPPKVEEQIKSEDEVIIDTNSKPEKKPVATGTCDLCGKTMLLTKTELCPSESVQEQTSTTNNTSSTSSISNNRKSCSKHTKQNRSL
jgi:hypothetical protein